MANLNKVFLMGNLTADPELRTTPKGTAVTDIRLAINRYYAGSPEGGGGDRQEETTFVDVTLWNRQAEIACTYLKKGQGVFIEGRLQLDSWEDRQSGQKRTKLRVIGENLQLMPRGGDSGPRQSGGYQQQSQSGYQQPQGGGFQNGGRASNSPSYPPQSSQPPADEFGDDDDIPF